MNKLLFTLFLTPIILLGEVPSLINYSGRLLNADGSPATGTVSVVVDIYDASTGGTKIYTESVGNVTLNQGVYSFEFGATGTSTVSTTETLATSDGSTTVYNYTVANPPIIAGTVSIADGTYTWSQASGSSSPSDFLGSVSNITSGTLSAIYLSGAPAQGTDITVTYDYNQTGIAGALQRGSQHWMEISIGGNAQSPRQRLVTVPFSATAKNLDGTHAEFDADGNLELKSGGVKFADGSVQSQAHEAQIRTFIIPAWPNANYWSPWATVGSNTTTVLRYPLPFPAGTKIRRIHGTLFDNSTGSYGDVKVNFLRQYYNSQEVLTDGGTTSAFQDGDFSLDIDLSSAPIELNADSAYSIEVVLQNADSNGTLGVKILKIDYLIP
jgi:hypothetical protein